MQFKKSSLALTVAAVLAASNAYAMVDLSASPVVPAKFASELLSTTTTALLNEAGNLDLTGKIGWGVCSPPAGLAAQRFEEMAAVIGADNAIRLGATFPDEEIYIPRCTIAMNALRDRQIIEDFDALIREMSAREAFNQLARRYRRSVTAIENTVNGKRRPSRAKSTTETH